MSHPKQNRKPTKPKRDIRKRAAALLALLLALLMILPMLSAVFQTSLAATQDELCLLYTSALVCSRLQM